jgi:uncharacterized damage-inducible protein DinB
MTSLSLLNEMFRYNYWARDRQLHACAAVSEDDFTRPAGGSFPSLRDTLAHLVGAEWLWLERWKGRSPSALPQASEFPTLALIEQHWSAVETDMMEWLGTVTEPGLLRLIVYRNLKGERWSYPLWRMMMHLVNHQTYHRGQVTALLRALGVAAPMVDFLVGVDARYGAT